MDQRHCRQLFLHVLSNVKGADNVGRKPKTVKAAQRGVTPRRRHKPHKHELMAQKHKEVFNAVDAAAACQFSPTSSLVRKRLKLLLLRS